MFDVERLYNLDHFKLSEHFQKKEKMFEFVEIVKTTSNYLAKKKFEILADEVRQHRRAISIISKLEFLLEGSVFKDKLNLDDEAIKKLKQAFRGIYDELDVIIFHFISRGGKAKEALI